MLPVSSRPQVLLERTVCDLRVTIVVDLVQPLVSYIKVSRTALGPLLTDQVWLSVSLS
jgi:hypothetical protein